MLAAQYKQLDLPLEAPDGGPRGDAHMARNPMGKIPVLLDGELVLPESDVILGYLEDRFPTPSLFPGDATRRAHVRLLTRLLDTYGPTSFGPFLQNDAPAIAMALQRSEACLGYLEHFWQPAVHAAGPDFSAADCALIPFFCIFDRLQGGFGTLDLVQARPRVAAWWSAARDSEPGQFAGRTLDAAVQQMLLVAD